MTPYLRKRCGCKKAGRKDCQCPWHYKLTRDGFTYRGSTGVSNKQLAFRRAVKLIENDIAARSGDPLPYPDLAGPAAGRVKLRTLGAAFFDWSDLESPATHKERVRIVTQFLDYVDPRSVLYVDDVTGMLIEKWKHWRAKSPALTPSGKRRKDGGIVSKQTVNFELTMVSKLFTKGQEWHGIPHPCRPTTLNPAGVQPFDNLTEKDIQTFDPDQLRILLGPGGLPHPLNLFARVTLECLPRLSELQELTADDVSVDWTPGAGRVGWLSRTLKGGKRLKVQIEADLADALLAELTPGQHYLFPQYIRNPHGRTKKERLFSISWKFTYAFAALGITGSHHGFRHTGVTRLLIAGYSDRYIAKLAGWGSTAMIKRYGHIKDEIMAKAVASNAAWLRDVLADTSPAAVRDLPAAIGGQG